MKKNRWKEMLVCICVLAAGICYLMSGAGAGMESRPQFVTDETQEYDLAGQETGGCREKPAAQAPDDGGKSSEGAAAAGKSAAAQETEEQLLYVHVCGMVESPGVYALKPGSRVFQAVEMAGGCREEAAVDFLNMAMLLEDGMRIEVPDQETAKLMVREESRPEAGAGSPGKVNINTASREQLMQLSGIGEARAEAIIAYREANGLFGKAEDIMKVSGIKEAAFQKIKESITV